MATIGFIGLGNMGAPMASNLVKAGHRVIGYDVNASALQAMASAGVQSVRSAAEAARGADVVITMLPAGEHVREVWLHQGGLIEAVKGAAPLLIDCSTIDVESARTVTEAARRRRIGDAGCAGFRRRRWRRGGDAYLHGRRQRGRVRARIAGAAGDGEEHRACRWSGRGAGGEDLQQHDARHQHGRRVGRVPAGTQTGLDWDKLFQIASTSSGQSWALSSYCPAPGPVPAAPSNRDYAAGFMAALMLKDVKLSQAAADAVGSPTPLAAHALSFYQAVVDAGDGAKDFSVVFRWLAAQPRQ